MDELFRLAKVVVAIHDIREYVQNGISGKRLHGCVKHADKGFLGAVLHVQLQLVLGKMVMVAFDHIFIFQLK